MQEGPRIKKCPIVIQFFGHIASCSIAAPIRCSNVQRMKYFILSIPIINMLLKAFFIQKECADVLHIPKNWCRRCSRWVHTNLKKTINFKWPHANDTNIPCREVIIKCILDHVSVSPIYFLTVLPWASQSCWKNNIHLFQWTLKAGGYVQWGTK